MIGAARTICYLERVGGGTFVRRVRLVGPGFDRVWNPPEPSAKAAESTENIPPAVLTSVREGANWVAQTLSAAGVKRLNALCVDSDGGVCTWLTAPSPEPAVVSAVLQHAAHGMGDGAGGAAGRLALLGAGSVPGMTSDISVQALAVADEDEQPEPAPSRVLSRLPGRRAAATASAHRERLAVLSIPDATVRVFIDELDALGVEVASVVSLWHALAAAWDPGSPLNTGVARVEGEGERIVSTSSPSTAIVLLDPLGRLVWAWSRAGELVAGGAMRLRSVSKPRPRAPEPEQAAPPQPGLARRVEGDRPAAEIEDDSVMLECSGAEVGRLVVDWLAWGAQLGQCPDRVVCFGPATAQAAAQTPGGATLSSLGEGLGSAWPGATVDVAVHNDPIGATLAHMAGAVAPGAADGAVHVLPGDDPRVALVGLSARAGRADRSMHRWAALGILGVAFIVAAIGWQFFRAAGGMKKAVADAQEERAAALARAEAHVPNISRMTEPPERALAAKLTELQNQAAAVKPQKPVLLETLRVLEAIGPAEGVGIKEFTVNPSAASVKLSVPDLDAGPEMYGRLQGLPGAAQWTAHVPPSQGTEHLYLLTGIWPVDIPPPPTGNQH